MTEIQRYDIGYKGVKLPNDDGEMIYHSDHIKAIKTEKAYSSGLEGIVREQKKENQAQAKEIERLKATKRKQAKDIREFHKAIGQVMKIATTEPEKKDIIKTIQSINVDSGMHT